MWVRGRVQLRQDFPGDAALLISDVQLHDVGRYHCEVVDGLEDNTVSTHLELQGETIIIIPRCFKSHQLTVDASECPTVTLCDL